VEREGASKNNAFHGRIKERILSKIAEYLTSKGYIVYRNAIVRGEGVKHRFDLVAKQSPIPGSNINLGIIVVENNVNTDLVEKLLGWIDEIHSIKIILIPLSRVDREAQHLAQKYGIDIVSPVSVLSQIKAGEEELLEAGHGIEVYYVEPKLSVEQVAELFCHKLKPSIFRTTKYSLSKIALLYYPLIEQEVEITKAGEEEEEAEVIEGSLVFDGLTGHIVVNAGGSFKFLRELGSLSELPDEAIPILKILSEERSLEIGALSARTHIDPLDLKPLLVDLSMRGLIDVYGDLVELKTIDAKYLHNIEEKLRKYGATIKNGSPSIDNSGIKCEPLIPLYKLEEVMISLGIEVVKTKILYYPLYVALLEEEKGDIRKEKIVIVNGITGLEEPGFAQQLTIPEFFDKIKSVKGYSIEKICS